MSLWRDTPASSLQESLCFEESSRPRRKRRGHTQGDVLLEMLRAARVARTPLELPEIMRAGIAQHGARMAELRERGFEIVNEMQRHDYGVRSWYRLVFDPERERRFTDSASAKQGEQ
jgi:hypothetical protein